VKSDVFKVPVDEKLPPFPSAGAGGRRGEVAFPSPGAGGGARGEVVFPSSGAGGGGRGEVEVDVV
jgi:hypothetical protein